MGNKLIDLLMNIPTPPNMISVGYRCAESGGRLFNAAIVADHLLANGVVVQEWIPVSERLPERDGEFIVLWANESRNGVAFYWAYHKEWYENGFTIYPTHWNIAKIGEPPKGEADA